MKEKTSGGRGLCPKYKKKKRGKQKNAEPSREREMEEV